MVEHDQLILQLITDANVELYFYNICVNFERKNFPAIVYSRNGEIKEKDDLIFDSKFESGNLNYAIKVNELYYLLFLQYDSNVIGHTQWFYFKITNLIKGQKIRFDIFNMVIFIISINHSVNTIQFIRKG